MCRKGDDGPWELQGLLSLTGHCASFNLPSVFTDVSTIHSWLLSTIGRHQEVNNQVVSISTTITTSTSSLPPVSSNSSSTTTAAPVVVPVLPLVKLSPDNSENHSGDIPKAIIAEAEKDSSKRGTDVENIEAL